jgi:antitoxin CcdA
MKHEAIRSRKAINLSLDSALVSEAKELGINVSRVCEDSLRIALSQVRGEQWIRQNQGAMEAWSNWIDKNGLPLEQYRQF